jgi:hypothetical protein
MSTTNLDHNCWITNKIYEDYYYNNCVLNNFNLKKYNLIYLELLNNIEINKKLCYKENIIYILKLYFNNNKIENIILNRLNYNFFNVKDLLYILN